MSAEDFSSRVSFFLNEGITQLSEPEPIEKEEMTSTLIQSEELSWQIIRKNDGLSITINRTTRFGRHPDNQIVLSEPSVSRWHAQIEIRGFEYWLNDLGSSNGTFLNGKRILQPSLLKLNDQIQIGSSVFMIQSPGMDQSGDMTMVESAQGKKVEAHSSNNPQSKIAMFCFSCGKRLVSEAKFCAYCGSPVIND
jgi:pSer/pThr/pTyr-binding forkhead associated (FHA) protein